MGPSRQQRRFAVASAIAATAVAIAFLALYGPLAGRIARWRLERRSGAVVAAAHALRFRPTEARLAGPFPYRPVGPAKRGDAALDPASLTLNAVVAELLAAGGAEPERFRQLAAAQLLTGHPAAAIDEIERHVPHDDGEALTAAHRSGDEALVNDLSAAYYERYRERRRASDLMASATLAARAYELNPRAPATAWNRALSLEALGLLEESREAWAAYLLIDDRSGWAEEARRHQSALSIETDAARWKRAEAALKTAGTAGTVATVHQIAVEFPLRTMQVVDREWIPRWAAESRAGKASAPALLDAIEGAGRALEVVHADAHVAAFAARARATQNDPAYARAHEALGEALDAMRTRGTGEAIEETRRAIALLRRSGSPMESPAKIALAGALYHAGRHEEALRELDSVSGVDAERSPLVAALAAWNRGVADASLGNVRRAAESYQAALQLYQRVNERTQTGMLQTLLADNAELTGKIDEAWTRYLDAVQETERHGEPGRGMVILDSFTRAALRQERPELARLLNAVLTARVRAVQRPDVLAHVLVTACEIDTALHRVAAALRQCGEARGIWSGRTDEAARDRLEADLEIATAAASSGDARLESLRRAVDVSLRRKDLFRLARVYLLRAREYTQRDATALARSDLETGLAAIEEQRERLEAVPDRITYFETSRGIATDLVRLLVASGEHDAALDVVERVRARGLLDRLVPASSTPAGVARVRSALSGGEAVVEYWADRDALYAWLIRREGITFRRSDVSRADLARAAGHFVSLLESSETDVAQLNRASSALFTWAVEPMAGALRDVTQLTIVPDESLSGLPFAVLRDPSTAHYLIERFALSYAPSAAAFAAMPAGGVRQSILVLADPETELGLRRLDVRDEVREAVRSIAHASIHEGRDATAGILRSGADAYDVIHIGAHALEESPLGEPALVFARGADDPNGLLAASEVERIRLRRGAVVVLAACSTGRGRRMSEGTISMARAFVAAGAGAVVATLWDASDTDAATLLPRFYAAMAGGESPAQALRDAQLGLLRTPNTRPQQWAVFQLIGGT